ncbi:MAG: RnfH family protein [Betaproteobacteria bacterium]|nr:RnfH family protein [Betaproteobacteria bacterium]
MRPNKPAQVVAAASPAGPAPAGASDRGFVDVVFVSGASQLVRRVPIGPRSTVAEAIDASGLLREHAASVVGGHGLSSFGRRVQPATRIRAGDRVEILLPLAMSPKEARRQLAAKRAGKKRG